MVVNSCMVCFAKIVNICVSAKKSDGHRNAHRIFSFFYSFYSLNSLNSFYSLYIIYIFYSLYSLF